MTRLFVRHPVKNYDAWRSAYDAFDQERRTMGVVSHAVFQSVDDPNEVTVFHDFDSPEKAKSFASSKRLKEVMEQAGVKGSPTIWFGNQT